MRTSRRFRPAFEFLSARIAPSSGAAIDPTEGGSTPEQTPIVRPDRPHDGPDRLGLRRCDPFARPDHRRQPLLNVASSYQAQPPRSHVRNAR